MSSRHILSVSIFFYFMSSLLARCFYDFLIKDTYQKGLLYNLDMSLQMTIKGNWENATAFVHEYIIKSRTVDLLSQIPNDLFFSGTLMFLPMWLFPQLENVHERMKKLLSLFIVSGGVLLSGGHFALAFHPGILSNLLLLGGYAWSLLGLAGCLIYATLHSKAKKTGNRKYS